MKLTLFPLFKLSLCTVGYFCSTHKIAIAQITSDDTTGTTVNADGDSFTIQDGSRRGGNLFHSFQDFSVPTGVEALFDNANDITNIFSRVTGGNISNIDGLIRANSNASLFLINPAGIIFGENASLDIGGSFYSSTADSIVFEDGEFSAVNNLNAPTLTINAPIGLNLRDNPSSIINRSSAVNNEGDLIGLEVSFGNTLGLIGGDVNFEGGSATAREGTIKIGGLANRGIISLETNDRLTFPENIARSNLSFTNAANVNVSGTVGGSISLDANNVDFSDASELIAGITTDSTSIEAQAGDIIINATGSISLESSFIDNQVASGATGNAGSINLQTTGQIIISGEESGIFGFVGEDGVGNSGNINLETRSLSLSDDGEINNSIQGEGNAGEINITAEEVSLVNGEISTEIDEGATGNAGSINLDTTRLLIADEAELNSSTNGQGDAGTVNINANEVSLVGGEISTGVESGAVGDAGNIIINTQTFSLREGSQIISSIVGATEELPGGIGSGGSIDINATNSVEISGINTETSLTGLFANSEDSATGNAGSIRVETDILRIDRGTIQANNLGMGDSQEAENNNAFATNIFLRSNNLFLNNGGSISAITQFGEGGNADIVVDDRIQLRNNSNITAGSFGVADGGNVTIDADFIIAFPNEISGNGNDIIAVAELGSGGNINILVDRVFGIEEGIAIPSNNRNDFDASSELSIQEGIVVNILDSVALPPSNLIESQQTVAQACRERRQANAKSGLTIEGKGGIVPDPKLPLNSLNVSVAGGSSSTSAIPEAINTSKGKIQPARGIKVASNGEIVLTAYRTDNSEQRTPQGDINCGV